MTYNTDLDEFLTTTVIYSAPTTMDVHGVNAAATATFTVPARIEHRTKWVTDAGGQEVISMTQVYLRPTSSSGAAVTPVVAGTLRMPVGNEPLVPPMITVTRIDDVLSEGGGIHHWEINC